MAESKEREYMGVRTLLRTDGWSAPTLGLYGFERYPDLKKAIQDKLNNQGMNARGVRESMTPVEYMVTLLESEIEDYIAEKCGNGTYEKEEDEKYMDKNKKKSGNPVVKIELGEDD